jgi:hypothetical protein
MAKKNIARGQKNGRVCERVHKIHKYPIKGSKSEGTLYDVKVFPPSKPGRTGFAVPPAPPKTRSFSNWFEYFIQAIGAAVEQLNAWQFNLDEQPKPTKPSHHQMRCIFADELDNLATVMQVGESHNPEKLIWPLNGVYVCDLALTVARDKDPYRLLLVVSFEADPDYRLVTNCSVMLIEPAAYNKPGGLTARPGPPAPKLINWNSSSSSSLATSSSSSTTPRIV